MIVATIFRLYIIKIKKDGSNLKWIVFTLYGIGAISVGITGYFGGTMVYKFLLGM